MEFCYTARSAFSPFHAEPRLSWADYIQWSRLHQLKEVVSVDGILNRDLVEFNAGKEVFWEEVVTADDTITGFYRNPDFVLQAMEPRERFNLLAVVIAPTQDCAGVEPAHFTFMGYDLLDKDYCNSALTNCGGFDETFLPTELNPFGLLSDAARATEICRLLPLNNPENPHANTNVIAIWRHQTIGQTRGSAGGF